MVRAHLEALMLLFLLAAAIAAPTTTPDSTVTIGTLEACVARVNDEYQAGDALPSRAKAAADSIDSCVTTADVDLKLLSARVVATATAFRAEKARIDEARRRHDPLGLTASTDPVVQAELDRARATLAPTPVEPVSGALVSLEADLRMYVAQYSELKIVIERAKEESARFLVIREGLWTMACTGEIVLPIGEMKPISYDQTRCVWDVQTRPWWE